jgi:hypothetical protein
LKDRNDIQPQRAQRVDYNRLKHERTQEMNKQKSNINSINPGLHEYAYPFHYQSENNNHGKRYSTLFFKNSINNPSKIEFVLKIERSYEINFLRIDADEPAHAKKLVIVNNKGTCHAYCMIDFSILHDGITTAYKTAD